MTKHLSVKLEKPREIPVFSKEGIGERSCLTEQIRSAIRSDISWSTLPLAEYTKCFGRCEKIWYSREIFLTFVILMIKLFPKHKFVFYKRHAQETILLFGKCYISSLLLWIFNMVLTLHCFKIGILSSPLLSEKPHTSI